MNNIMWKFLAGFSVGVYVGTYYDCKPYIIKIKKIAKDNFPDIRDNNDNQVKDNKK